MTEATRSNDRHKGHRVTAWLPDDLYQAVLDTAKAEDRSVNSVVRRGVMHITQRGFDQLDEQEARVRSGSWSSESVAKMLETKDEEIARLKRELATRPEPSTAALVDYARRTGARGVPEVDAAIERGETGTPPKPFLEPAVRRARQAVIDAALRGVNRTTKAKP